MAFLEQVLLITEPALICVTLLGPGALMELLKKLALSISSGFLSSEALLEQCDA